MWTFVGDKTRKLGGRSNRSIPVKEVCLLEERQMPALCGKEVLWRETPQVHRHLGSLIYWGWQCISFLSSKTEENRRWQNGSAESTSHLLYSSLWDTSVAQCGQGWSWQPPPEGSSSEFSFCTKYKAVPLFHKMGLFVFLPSNGFTEVQALWNFPKMLPSLAWQ